MPLAGYCPNPRIGRLQWQCHARPSPAYWVWNTSTSLVRSDLLALLRRLSGIETDHRLSCYRANLMLQAVDADGATHYVAVEASYMADRRDANRALRNAEFLQRCTGCPAHAVIASVNNDREVQRLVANGAVHWYRLTDEDLETEWHDSSLRPDLPATLQLH